MIIKTKSLNWPMHCPVLTLKNPALTASKHCLCSLADNCTVALSCSSHPPAFKGSNTDTVRLGSLTMNWWPYTHFLFQYSPISWTKYLGSNASCSEGWFKVKWLGYSWWVVLAYLIGWHSRTWRWLRLAPGYEGYGKSTSERLTRSISLKLKNRYKCQNWLDET